MPGAEPFIAHLSGLSQNYPVFGKEIRDRLLDVFVDHLLRVLLQFAAMFL